MKPNPSHLDPAAEQWRAASSAMLDPNAIRAPIQSEFARIEFKPVPITELGPSVPPNWIWPGYIARSHSTLLVSLWKAGKTTLVAHLLRDAQQGGGLIGDRIEGNVLVLSEERTELWTARRDEMGLNETLSVVCRPFKVRPTMAQWTDYNGQIADWVRQSGSSLVVMDTLAALWPVTNENDASEVQDALMPTHAITEAGAALVLDFHPRKGDGTEGQATRGSGALTGFVDIIIEMRRLDPSDPRDRRRVLTGYGRFDDTPPESVIELGEGGYRYLGDRAHLRASERMSIIGDLLPAAPPGLTAEQVRERFLGVKPGKRSIEHDLGKGVEDARWQVSGTGKRNDARRYYLAAPLDSRNHSSYRCANANDLPGGNP